MHLRKHYADVPVWEHDPYVGEPVWPLVTVSGRELKVRDQLYVGITEEQADRWNKSGDYSSRSVSRTPTPTGKNRVDSSGRRNAS